MHDVLQPAGRVAPPAVRRALQSLEPGAEWVYLGHGEWQIVRRRPYTDTRLQTAQRMLRQAYERCLKGRGSERTWAKALSRARLARLGYSLGPTYHIQGEPTSEHLKDFERRRYDVERARDFMLRVDEEEEARKAAVIAEYSDPSRCREASRAARNPVTYTMPGLRRPV